MCKFLNSICIILVVFIILSESQHKIIDLYVLEEKMIYFINSYDYVVVQRASLVAQMVKNLPAIQENWNSIPRLGRFPGERNGYLNFQNDCP